MPVVSTIDYPLVASQNGKRVRLQVSGTIPVVVQVGDPNETWPEGCVIEIVRVGASPAVTIVAYDVSVTLNQLGGINLLEDGEYARVNLVSPGVWDMHVYKLPSVDSAGFMFQVGTSFNTDHYHYAMLSMADAQMLVQTTTPLLPVGDVGQPSVVITSADNGNSSTHSHNLTVMFDYTNRKFIVTAISNNPNGGDTPHVAWMVGDIIPTPGAAYSVLTSDGPNAAPYWNTPVPGVELLDDLTDVNFGPYPPDNGEVLTFNSTLGAWEPQTPQAQPYDLKGRPMETVPLAGTAETIGSSRHHNTHFRTSSATAVTITIPADSSWPGIDLWHENGGFPINPGPMPPGGSMIVGKHGAGNVTFVPGPGVTINTPDTLTISSLHGKATLIKVGTDVWDLEGNIGA